MLFDKDAWMKNLGKQCGLCLWYRKKKSIKSKSCREKGFLETSPACPKWELDDKHLPKSVRQLLYLLPELTLLQIKALLYHVKDKKVDFTTEGVTKTCNQCAGYRKKRQGKNCKQQGIKPTDCCKDWELDFATTRSIFRESYGAIEGIPAKGPWDLVRWLLKKAMRQFGDEFRLGEVVGFEYRPAVDTKRTLFVRGNVVDISEANVLMRTKSGRYFNILRRHTVKQDQWEQILKRVVTRKGKKNAKSGR